MSEANSTIETRDLSIIGLPGYHVSADGRVWTSKRLIYFKGEKAGCTVAYDGPMKEMRQRVSNQEPGYMVVNLTNPERKQKIQLVHRLVLLAFIGPCPEGMECCHDDGNPKNNNLTNLKWGTHSNNSHDKKRHGTQPDVKGEANGYHKLNDEEAVYIRQRYAAGGITYRELAEEFNVAKSTIRWVVIGATWKHI